jgi:hypothetical protein
VASLALSLPAAHAQQAQDRDRAPAAGASQPSAPQATDRANDRDGDRAQPRRGQGGGATPSGNRTRAGDEGRQRGGPAQAQDQESTRGSTRGRAEQTPGRSEQSRPSGQAGERTGQAERSGQTGERSGERASEQRRDRQRNEARDSQRDRAGQERSRTGERSGQDRSRERTTEQSREDRATESRRSRDSDGDRRDRADTERRDRGDSDRRDRADRRQDSQRGSVSLSEEQRTRISTRFSERIDRMNVRPLSRSRLSVSVGVVVPSSIRLYDVPRDIVEIYPNFRGHKFVVVDDEIVIIEPRTRRVVTTLSRSGERSVSRSRSTTGVAAGGSGIRLRDEDRSRIRTVVMREAQCRFEQRIDFRIGLPLPRTVEICEFPDEVVSAIPEVRRYRYVVRGDDIVLVDPDEHRIVEVID